MDCYTVIIPNNTRGFVITVDEKWTFFFFFTGECMVIKYVDWPLHTLDGYNKKERQ